MTDVLMRQTVNGGDVECSNGQMVMDEGLENAVYLSLFGGNEDDSGLEADDAKQWWGNRDEPEGASRYRSAAQYLLATLPLIPASLQRIEEAATSDLSWMTDSIATDVAVRAAMPAPKRIDLTVYVTIDGKTTNFTIPAPSKI